MTAKGNVVKPGSQEMSKMTVLYCTMKPQTDQTSPAPFYATETQTTTTLSTQPLSTRLRPLRQHKSISNLAPSLVRSTKLTYLSENEVQRKYEPCLSLPFNKMASAHKSKVIDRKLRAQNDRLKREALEFLSSFESPSVSLSSIDENKEGGGNTNGVDDGINGGVSSQGGFGAGSTTTVTTLAIKSDGKKKKSSSKKSDKAEAKSTMLSSYLSILPEEGDDEEVESSEEEDDEAGNNYDTIGEVGSSDSGGDNNDHYQERETKINSVNEEENCNEWSTNDGKNGKSNNYNQPDNYISSQNQAMRLQQQQQLVKSPSPPNKFPSNKEEYEYYNDNEYYHSIQTRNSSSFFSANSDNDSLVAMAKRLDDASIISDPTSIYSNIVKERTLSFHSTSSSSTSSSSTSTARSRENETTSSSSTSMARSRGNEKHGQLEVSNTNDLEFAPMVVGKKKIMAQKQKQQQGQQTVNKHKSNVEGKPLRHQHREGGQTIQKTQHQEQLNTPRQQHEQLQQQLLQLQLQKQQLTKQINRSKLAKVKIPSKGDSYAYSSSFSPGDDASDNDEDGDISISSSTSSESSSHSSSSSSSCYPRFATDGSAANSSKESSHERVKTAMVPPEKSTSPKGVPNKMTRRTGTAVAPLPATFSATTGDTTVPSGESFSDAYAKNRIMNDEFANARKKMKMKKKRAIKASNISSTVPSSLGVGNHPSNCPTAMPPPQSVTNITAAKNGWTTSPQSANSHMNKVPHSQPGALPTTTAAPTAQLMRDGTNNVIYNGQPLRVSQWNDAEAATLPAISTTMGQKKKKKKNNGPKVKVSDWKDDSMHGIGFNTRIHDKPPTQKTKSVMQNNAANLSAPPAGAPYQHHARASSCPPVSSRRTNPSNSHHKLKQHQQQQHVTENDAESAYNSDCQTQFFYESDDSDYYDTSDEEDDNMPAVGRSVAEAVADLNNQRALTKVKNLLRIR